MLFIFETNAASSFWMGGMKFPLDFIWISEECTVAHITHNAPAPDPESPDAPLPSYSPPDTAAYNFEVNAGAADAYGIEVGDTVRFTGMPEAAGDACQ